MEMITRVWACQKFFYIYIFLYYTQVDKLVGDIYGDDYQGLGLSEVFFYIYIFILYTGGQASRGHLWR
jgi:hypothetical protein